MIKNDTDSSANANSNGGASAFADVALDDDVPKINMSFGTIKDDKPSSSGFGLGSWGNGIGSTWGLGGGKTTTSNTWGFDALNGDSTDITTTNSSKDTKSPSTDASEPSWSFGGNKKNKKKETASAFDFGNLGTDEGQEIELNFGETGDSNPAAPAEEDPWASSFTAVKKGGKKDKKKKGAIEELPEHEAPVVDVPLKDQTVDTFGGFGSWAKPKKDKVIDVPIPPPPAPMAPIEDAWSAPTTTKGKKKKKGAFDEPVASPPPSTQVLGDDHSVDVGGGDGWADFSFDGDKKKSKKKGSIDVVQENPAIGTTFDIGFGATNDDSWAFGAQKPKAKKGKGVVEEIQKDEPISVLSPVTTNDTVATESNDYSTWGTAGKKNSKTDKTKKGAKPLESGLMPHPPPVPSSFDFFNTGAETGVDSGWAPWGSEDKKKKDNLMSFDDDVVDVPIMEDKTELDVDPFAGLTPKERKKKERELEKEKKEKEKVDASAGLDTGWSSFGSKDKKQKGLVMGFDDGLINVPLVADKEEPAMDPLAGLTASARRKKEKELKEAKEKAEKEAAEKAEAEEAPVDPLAGLMGLPRRKKEKELEKEKKEKDKAE